MSFVGATWVAFSLPMLLSFVGGRLADRHSRFFLMFLGFGMSAVAWITYGLVQLLPFLLIMNAVEGLSTVSYTHLDVYKRQLFAFYPESPQDFTAVATAFADEYAPEHLEIHLDQPRVLLESLHSAGAIFLGHHTPTAYGDYVAGSNHVLPTGGSARFASALGAVSYTHLDVYKRQAHACRSSDRSYGLTTIGQCFGSGFVNGKSQKKSLNRQRQDAVLQARTKPN